jgi:hypothetical protein
MRNATGYVVVGIGLLALAALGRRKAAPPDYTAINEAAAKAAAEVFKNKAELEAALRRQQEAAAKLAAAKQVEQDRMNAGSR